MNTNEGFNQKTSVSIRVHPWPDFSSFGVVARRHNGLREWVGGIAA